MAKISMKIVQQYFGKKIYKRLEINTTCDKNTE